MWLRELKKYGRKLLKLQTWQGLPKRMQSAQGKQGANFSYDHLRLAIKDPLIPLKLQFFE